MIRRCKYCKYRGQLGNTVFSKWIDGRFVSICSKCLEAYHNMMKPVAEGRK